MEILNTLFTGPAAALTSSTQQAINSPPKDLTRSPQNNMTRSREPRVVGNQSPPLQFPQEQDCEAGQNKRLPGREMMGDASWDCANDVTNASMEEPPKYILNGRLHGRAKAPWRTPAPSHSPPVKTIDPPNMVAVGLLLHHGKKKENGTRVHFVSGLTPGAAAQSGRIAVNDQLLAVNGKDCSKLDGKQVHDLVVGLEGSSITMEFLRERPEAAAPRHESYHHLHQNSDDNKNERFEVVLIRGGVGCFAYTKKLEDGEMVYKKLIEEYVDGWVLSSTSHFPLFLAPRYHSYAIATKNISEIRSRSHNLTANLSLIPFPSPHGSRQVARGEFLAIK